MYTYIYISTHQPCHNTISIQVSYHIQLQLSKQNETIETFISATSCMIWNPTRCSGFVLGSLCGSPWSVAVHC